MIETAEITLAVADVDGVKRRCQAPSAYQRRLTQMLSLVSSFLP